MTDIKEESPDAFTSIDDILDQIDKLQFNDVNDKATGGLLARID